MQNAAPVYANDSSPMQQMPVTATSPISPAPVFYTPAASPMSQQYMSSAPSYRMLQPPFTYYPGYQPQYGAPMAMNPGDELATQFASMNLVPGTPQLVAPQIATHEFIPHRVFVGGFSPQTVEEELRAHFEQFFHVIRNNEGVSKGYGFITFNSEEEANRVRELEADKLEFKGRKLNLGPALRRISTRYHSEYTMASPSGTAPYQVFAYPSQSVYMPSSSPYSPQHLYTPVEAALPMQPVTPPRSHAPSPANSPQ